jgi:hypothetical protein
MDFEKWLNKADKEIAKRKKKDSEREGGLAKDYDERIHKLYGDYKTDKNSKVMLFVTIILVLVTIFYAIQTSNLNHITSNQFESENRPYIYVEGVYSESYENVSIYNLNITNFGKFPGRLFNMVTKPSGCEGEAELIVQDFEKTTVIRPEEDRIFQIKETGRTFGKYNITIILEYTGVGGLQEKFYNYTLTLEVDKNKTPTSISIKEGRL